MARPKLKATVYDKKGKILSIAYNSYCKTHPLQYQYAKKAGYEDKIFLHAEINAIIKAMKKGNPYKIKVERYYKNGKPANATPCPICMMAIKEAGIKKIEFTI